MTPLGHPWAWLHLGGRGRQADWAAIYRGPATMPGCPEAAAAMIRAHGLRTRFVGPRERLSLSAALRPGAGAPRLYVQPGGDELDDAWVHLEPSAEEVRSFVARGGAYLGLCLGGYLAGVTPGYALLPAGGDTDQYSSRPGALLTGSRSGVLTVRWGDQPRDLYAQDPPVFEVDEAAEGLTVLGRYADGSVAALVARCGQGRVGVIGPHPEATSDWFEDDGLRPVDPAGSQAVGRDLVRALLDPAAGRP